MAHGFGEMEADIGIPRGLMAGVAAVHGFGEVGVESVFVFVEDVFCQFVEVGVLEVLEQVGGVGVLWTQAPRARASSASTTMGRMFLSPLYPIALSDQEIAKTTSASG